MIRAIARAAGTALVFLVALVSADVIIGASDHHDDMVLATTIHRLHDVRGQLAATGTAITSTETMKAKRQAAIDQTDREIAATTGDIRQASATGTLQTIDISTLDTCLNGVSTARAAVAAGNTGDAVQAITSVSAACLTVDGSSSGLAYPFDFPDPFSPTKTV